MPNNIVDKAKKLFTKTSVSKEAVEDNSGTNKELSDWLKTLVPEVIGGFPSAWAYKGGEDIGTYVEINCAGDSSEWLKSEVIDDFKTKVLTLVSGSKRIIVRHWPEIIEDKDLKNGKQIYKVWTRLLADDGTPELRTE